MPSGSRPETTQHARPPRGGEPYFLLSLAFFSSAFFFSSAAFFTSAFFSSAALCSLAFLLSSAAFFSFSAFLFISSPGLRLLVHTPLDFQLQIQASLGFLSGLLTLHSHSLFLGSSHSACPQRKPQLSPSL